MNKSNQALSFITREKRINPTTYMKFKLLTVFAAFMCCSIIANSQLIFNKFSSNFKNETVPVVIDENFMSHQIENPEDHKLMDPIFYEYILTESEKEKVYKRCGGYVNVDSCSQISFISKTNLSPTYNTFIYSEKILSAEKQELIYFLVIFDTKGKFIDKKEIAKIKYEGAEVNVWEAYLFNLEDLITIKKSYTSPENLKSISKENFEITKKGKIEMD